MDKAEENENLASSINVPFVYQQTSVSAPVITVQSMQGGQCSTQGRDLKPSVKPTIPTESALRGIGTDNTETVISAGSQRATELPEVKFNTSKPSMSLSADQNRSTRSPANVRLSSSDCGTINSWRTMFRPSEDLGTLSETDQIHRSC